MEFPKSDGSLARLSGEELRSATLVWAARLRRAASIYDLDFVPAPATLRSAAVQDLYADNFADKALQIAAEIIERRGVGTIPDGPELSERDGDVGMMVIGRKQIAGQRPLRCTALFLEFLARKLVG